MKRYESDKRAIGFGRMLALMTFVLFGLMIWFFTIANQRIEASIGTEELQDIDTKNLDSYFADSMNLGFDNALREAASTSFIDKNVIDCRLTSEGIFILDNNCKPNSDFIKIILEDETAAYIKEYLSNYPIDNQKIEVSCNIEEENYIDIIKCQTSEIVLNSSRKNKFFSYSIKYKFRLNDSFRVDEKIRTTEINEIFEKFGGCRDRCKLDSEFWSLDKTEERGNYLIYSLTNKKVLVPTGTEPIKWTFAIEKR